MLIQSESPSMPIEYLLLDDLIQLCERVDEFVAEGGLMRLRQRGESAWTPSGDDAGHLYDLGCAATKLVNYDLIEVGPEFQGDRFNTMDRGDNGSILLRERRIYVRRGGRTSMARTLLHELAHALSVPLLREREKASWLNERVRMYGECIAEFAATTVMHLRGCDITHASVPYLASWRLPHMLNAGDFAAAAVATAVSLNGLLTRAEEHIQTYAA